MGMRYETARPASQLASSAASRVDHSSRESRYTHRLSWQRLSASRCPQGEPSADIDWRARCMKRPRRRGRTMPRSRSILFRSVTQTRPSDALRRMTASALRSGHGRTSSWCRRCAASRLMHRSKREDLKPTGGATR